MLIGFIKHLRTKEGSDKLLRPQAEGKRRPRAGFLLALAVLVLMLQPACALRRLIFNPVHIFQKRAPAEVHYPTSPIRVAYLPANIPADNKDMRWIALAAPIMMAKISESAQDLEVVPFWEVMPLALESAGPSRSLTPEGTADIADRMAAKWATYSDMSPVSRGIEMVLDYVPAKPTSVPYRYTRIGNVDEIGYGFYSALEQFTRYLMAHPIDLETIRETRLNSLRPLAEAIDLEYGWFVTADPGKAERIVADLARYDGRLARLIFSPSLYPALGNTPAIQQGEATPKTITPQSR
jgi:hypothetical protein